MVSLSPGVVAPVIDTAADEPAERRMFQLTDLTGNHNKFYLVEIWPMQGDNVRFRVSWGRVGSKPQVGEKVVTWRELERQIEEKLRKGYCRVELHRPSVELVTDESDGADRCTGTKSAVHLDPRVAQLVDWVFSEAGEHIQSYLAVEVGGLSQAQIDEGRKLLAQAQSQYIEYGRDATAQNMALLAHTVQAYYNAIPTKLPARVDREQVVLGFCKDFSEQEDRLLQIEAAVASIKAHRQDPGLSIYQALGAQVEVLLPEDAEYRTVAEYIGRTQVHGYKIKPRDVFSVHIPAERKAYEQNKRGVSRRELLFHGTRNQNVRHILRQGLICPSTPSNGRMLGNGIYLANTASKSANYCSTRRSGIPRMLLLVEAALGRCYVAPEAKAYNSPPLFHDSLCGGAGHTRIGGLSTLMNDEFVVYSPAQQTIRYLVTFDMEY